MDLDTDDRDALNAAVRVLNTQGRAAAEYLQKLLNEEDNEEADAWLEVHLS